MVISMVINYTDYNNGWWITEPMQIWCKSDMASLSQFKLGRGEFMHYPGTSSNVVDMPKYLAIIYGSRIYRYVGGD